MYFRSNNEVFQGPGFVRENQHPGNTSATHTTAPSTLAVAVAFAVAVAVAATAATATVASFKISLRSLIGTRGEPCGDTTCERTQCAGIQFIPMPQNAADACEKFRIFLDWWMDKVELDADESIEVRARDRVLEMRESIPDVALVSPN
ncbi:hypothetical protein O1611_g5999 [Lasiodiplodia mahajangana]|uniref:Uncharacterized protein n=1 Tax=Lasiodiplodia mahajangana TaxID=1108764 RepID=A0ACC2JJV7_9PEZI|nr:hypothetical protein O1611_g5999 [Lasiodiplodia mahajangana]